MTDPRNGGRRSRGARPSRRFTAQLATTGSRRASWPHDKPEGHQEPPQPYIPPALRFDRRSFLVRTAAARSGLGGPGHRTTRGRRGHRPSNRTGPTITRGPKCHGSGYYDKTSSAPPAVRPGQRGSTSSISPPTPTTVIPAWAWSTARKEPLDRTGPRAKPGTGSMAACLQCGSPDSADERSGTTAEWPTSCQPHQGGPLRKKPSRFPPRLCDAPDGPWPSPPNFPPAQRTRPATATPGCRTRAPTWSAPDDAGIWKSTCAPERELLLSFADNAKIEPPGDFPKGRPKHWFNHLLGSRRTVSVCLPPSLARRGREVVVEDAECSPVGADEGPLVLIQAARCRTSSCAIRGTSSLRGYAPRRGMAVPVFRDLTQESRGHRRDAARDGHCTNVAETAA
jgi:hypothetical protein